MAQGIHILTKVLLTSSTEEEREGQSNPDGFAALAEVYSAHHIFISTAYEKLLVLLMAWYIFQTTMISNKLRECMSTLYGANLFSAGRTVVLTAKKVHVFALQARHMHGVGVAVRLKIVMAPNGNRAFTKSTRHPRPRTFTFPLHSDYPRQPTFRPGPE